MAQIDDLDYKAGAVINVVLSISDVIAIEAIIKAVAQKAMVRTAVVAVEEEAGNGAVKGELSFNKGVLERFIKHAFAGSRHADLGLSVETMASKGMNLVESNIHLLKAGDNTLIGDINGIQKSFKVFVQDGKIMSVNMYPGVSSRVTQGTTINFGNVTW